MGQVTDSAKQLKDQEEEGAATREPQVQTGPWKDFSGLGAVLERSWSSVTANHAAATAASQLADKSMHSNDRHRVRHRPTRDFGHRNKENNYQTEKERMDTSAAPDDNCQMPIIIVCQMCLETIKYGAGI